MSAVLKNETLNTVERVGLHLTVSEESSASEKIHSHRLATNNLKKTTMMEGFASRKHGLLENKFLDPAKIRLSDIPNRNRKIFSKKAFKNLCCSMKVSGGNVIPIQVRKLNSHDLINSNGEEYELISGEMRLEAAILNRQSVLGLIFDELEEIDCALLKIIENSNRLNLSVYEYGLQIKYLNMKFPDYSQEDMGAIFGLHKSTVCRALKLAELPVKVVDAFSFVSDLQYKDADILMGALTQNESNVINEAILIATQREDSGIKLKRKEVIKRLLDAAKNCETASDNSDCISIMRETAEIGKISRKKRGVTINLNSDLSDEQFLIVVSLIEKAFALK